MLDSLELELQTVVNYLARVLSTQLRSSGKSSTPSLLSKPRTLLGIFKMHDLFQLYPPCFI